MKRILTILLAVTMIGAITTTAFAQTSSNGKITGMAGNLSIGYSDAGETGGVHLGEVNPNDKRVEYIDLTDAMFIWDDNYIPATIPTTLTAAQIRGAKLTVRASNSKVVDSVTVNSSKGRIEIKFKDELVSVKEMDFDFDVTLSIDGRRQSDYAMNFTGTFANEVVEVGKDEETADLSDGVVLDPQDYIKKIDLDLGNDVHVIKSLSKGSKVYGTTTYTPDSRADEVMAKYKDIENVVMLKTVGLRASGNIVKIGGNYHIYDESLKYVGKSGELLPFSNRYYLAVKKLDITDNDVSDTDASEAQSTQAAPIATVPAATPEYPANVNDNPGTGR